MAWVAGLYAPVFAQSVPIAGARIVADTAPGSGFTYVHWLRAPLLSMSALAAAQNSLPGTGAETWYW